jgi:hypothetical protein
MLSPIGFTFLLNVCRARQVNARDDLGETALYKPAKAKGDDTKTFQVPTVEYIGRHDRVLKAKMMMVMMVMMMTTMMMMILTTTTHLWGSSRRAGAAGQARGERVAGGEHGSRW